MPSASKAAVLLGIGEIEVREFPLPKIGSDDGLLRVEATGVCGSDWAAFSKGLSMYELPCIMGHELVATVVEIGDTASRRWDIRAGDRLVVEEYLPCGICRGCLTGHYQMCVQTRYGGKSIADPPALWGGYSEYMYLHPRALVHRVGEKVDARLVQLYIPISNGIHWVQEVGRARVGGTVVVLGPGPHGLGCVIAAREAGAERVILVGLARDRKRLEVGKLLGADHTLCLDEIDVVEAVGDLTHGRYADTVVNAANAAAAFATAVEVAGDLGTVVQAGIGKGAADGFRPEALVDKVVTVHGVRGRPSRAVEPALRIIESGAYPLDAMCTHAFSIDETRSALLAVGTDPAVIRAVVTPTETREQ